MVEGAGYSIRLHSMALFFGTCMEFSLHHKSPVGSINKVRIN